MKKKEGIKMHKYVLTGTLVTIVTLAGIFYNRKTPIEDFEIKSPVVEPQPKTPLPVPVTRKIIHINNSSDDTVIIKGEITKSLSERVVSELKDKKSKNEVVWVLIDSPGGSVIDGATILTEIENSTIPVNTVCLRICASMGFAIHQYGKNRYTLNRSILMSHNASGQARGEVPKMINLLATIQRFVTKINSYVAFRAGMSLTDYENLISTDFWIDAEDAVERKFSDGLVSLEYLGPVTSEPMFPMSERSEKIINFKW